MFNNNEVCAGCQTKWSEYKMTVDDAISYKGFLYCNVDCAHDDEKEHAEFLDYLDECGIGY